MDQLSSLLRRWAARLAVLASLMPLTACGAADDITGALFPASPKPAAAIKQPDPPADMRSEGEKMAQAGDSLVMEGRDLIAEGQARIAQGERMAAEAKRIQEEARAGHVSRRPVRKVN